MSGVDEYERAARLIDQEVVQLDVERGRLDAKRAKLVAIAAEIRGLSENGGDPPPHATKRGKRAEKKQRAARGHDLAPTRAEPGPKTRTPQAANGAAPASGKGRVMEAILATLAKAGRPCSVAEVAKAISSPSTLAANQALSYAAKAGRIQRVGRGLYALPEKAAAPAPKPPAPRVHYVTAKGVTGVHPKDIVQVMKHRCRNTPDGCECLLCGAVAQVNGDLVGVECER